MLYHIDPIAESEEVCEAVTRGSVLIGEALERIHVILDGLRLNPQHLRSIVARAGGNDYEPLSESGFSEAMARELIRASGRRRI
jgi:hypothetical protein